MTPLSAAVSDGSETGASEPAPARVAVPPAGVSLCPYADWVSADIRGTHVLGHAAWVQGDELPGVRAVAPWHDDGRGVCAAPPISEGGGGGAGCADTVVWRRYCRDDDDIEPGAQVVDARAPHVLRRAATPWRVLLQLGSEGGAGMMWATSATCTSSCARTT